LFAQRATQVAPLNKVLTASNTNVFDNVESTSITLRFKAVKLEGERKMRRFLIAVIVVLTGVLLLVVGSAARSSASIAQQIPKEGKEQP